MKILHKLDNVSKKLVKQKKAGFTIVELSLTMAFVGVLLITIAIVTTNIVTIYQKGMTIKAVNSVGRGLVDELVSAINTAPSVDTTSLCNSLVTGDTNVRRCIKENAFDYIYHAQYDAAEGYQYNGILCTGHYSYLWNTYYGIEAGHTIAMDYYGVTGYDASGDPIYGTVRYGGSGEDAVRLARIEDKTYRLCSAVVDNGYVSHYNDYSSGSPINITTLANGSTVNLTNTPEEGFLDEFDLDLMLYEFTVFPISQDWVTLRTYMSGTFILATLRGGVDIMRSGDYCNVTEPDGISGSSLENLGAEFNYCAINKFNFAARTAGV